MSVVGELEGFALELGMHIDDLADEHEIIEEHWEGDPPSFTVEEVKQDIDSPLTILVTTSTGNRFTVTVAVAE